ncbi:MAG: hypothetical protein JXB32_25960 [Deltaproteobacteria bacterium]|nr:hypothetical protein [Deltaproteobacteria bacterium]
MEPVLVTRLTVAELVNLVVPRLAQQLLDALTEEASSNRRGRGRKKVAAGRTARPGRAEKSERTPQAAP